MENNSFHLMEYEVLRPRFIGPKERSLKWKMNPRFWIVVGNLVSNRLEGNKTFIRRTTLEADSILSVACRSSPSTFFRFRILQSSLLISRCTRGKRHFPEWTLSKHFLETSLQVQVGGNRCCQAATSQGK